MEHQQLLTLLLRVAVAASLASILSRFSAFQLTLMREDRTLVQRFKLALMFWATYGGSVLFRVLNPAKYDAVDLGLEGSLLAGMVGGYVTGLLSGILISIPAVAKGQLMTMLLFAGIGVLGGLLRDLAPEKEDVWRFSPIFSLNPRRLRQRPYQLRLLFQLGCLFSIIFSGLLRVEMKFLFPLKDGVFLAPIWTDTGWATVLAAYASSVFAVMLPLKIWNNTRNEKKLEAQQLRLNEARLAALTSQINPHFLFNTLNSVSSLIRTNPEQARGVVYRLSSILRRLLRNTDNLTPLREELAFIDNYMTIEMVRFGEKLRFVKDIDPQTLDRLVPSMLLQPLIENSIRHGLATKVDGGLISVRSYLADGRLHLVVEDDGVGIPEARLATLFEQGIGVSNVNERMKVLYGPDYRMWIDSKPGEGTRTGIEIPDVQVSSEVEVPAAG
ncbi:MAG: histidine kinase [Bryobacteraceae bacterium]|jgi:two-component system LytT family sensor kinase